MITKIVSETERSTTVQATTELTKVKFNDAWNYYAIRNDGSAEAYVSKRAFSNTTEDGVISIPAQGVASIPASVKSIYITGSGSVLVLGQNTPSLPFKAASKGGETGGGLTLIYSGALSSSPSKPTTFDGNPSAYTALVICENTSTSSFCSSFIIPTSKISSEYISVGAYGYFGGTAKGMETKIKFDNVFYAYGSNNYYPEITVYGI